MSTALKRKPDSSPSFSKTPTDVRRKAHKLQKLDNETSVTSSSSQFLNLPNLNFRKELPKPEQSVFEESPTKSIKPYLNVPDCSPPPTPQKSSRKKSPTAVSLVVNSFYLTTPEQQMFRTPNDITQPLNFYQTEFEELNEIGKGSFYTVFKVRNKSDQKLYAIKLKNRANPNNTSRTIAELQAAFGISNHPNCVRHYQAWDESGLMYVQTELCDLNLESFLDEQEIPLTEDHIWKFILDVCMGVEHIHSNGFVHLDIKPANIMICFMNHNEKVLKIGDFGQAIKLSKFKFADVETDSTYIAPELWSKSIELPGVNSSLSSSSSSSLQNDFAYVKNADVFSTGLSFIEICSACNGKSRLRCPPKGELWAWLRSGEVTFDLLRKKNLLSNEDRSQELETLILQMIHPDPSSRISNSTILQHTYLKPFKKPRQSTLNQYYDSVNGSNLSSFLLQNQIGKKKREEERRNSVEAMVGKLAYSAIEERLSQVSISSRKLSFDCSSDDEE